ncbi:MAG: hypothetical protein JWL92_211 [Candidatus Nomurabacteria bacterium]|nr:hypothetical protein [Candidatus Nomurabacteria bacterium]
MTTREIILSSLLGILLISIGLYFYFRPTYKYYKARILALSGEIGGLFKLKNTSWKAGVIQFAFLKNQISGMCCESIGTKFLVDTTASTNGDYLLNLN